MSAKDLAIAAELPYEALVHPLDLGRGPAQIPDDVIHKLASALKASDARVRAACTRSRENLLGGSH
jgi:hypothetical protein